MGRHFRPGLRPSQHPDRPDLAGAPCLVQYGGMFARTHAAVLTASALLCAAGLVLAQSASETADFLASLKPESAVTGGEHVQARLIAASDAAVPGHEVARRRASGA